MLCAQLFLFIFSLYPFQAGTWFNTEPAMLALFIFGVLNALWLGIGSIKNWLILERPVHPFMYILLAWVGWQFIALPFAENKYRSIIGIPQTGEGAAWQVLLLIIIFLIMPLWENLRYKKIILSVGAVSLCVMSYLHFNPKIFCFKLDNYIDDNPATPANWPDYLAFIAAYLWLVFASVQSLHKPKTYMFMIMLCAATIFISSNTAANYFIYSMLIITGLALWFRIWRRKPHFISWLLNSHKLLKIIAVIGVFAPFYFVAISQQPERFPCKNDTLASRAVFNQVVISKLQHESEIFWTGRGYGGFSDDMFKYGMVDGLYSFKDGIYKPNCMWLNGNVFHSHNQPMEVLLSLGVLGFLLFMAIPISLLLQLRNALFWWCVPILLAAGAMSFTWFTLPQVLPFQALAYAALCAARKVKIRKGYKISPVFYVSVFMASLFFAACAWQQFQAIQYGNRLSHIRSESLNQSDIKEFIAQDIDRGGERLIAGAGYYVKEILGRINSGQVNDEDRQWYKIFFELIHNAAFFLNNPNFAKLDNELSMLPFRLPKSSSLDELKPQLKKTLEDSVVRISEIAPEREDFTASYLMSLEDATGGDIKEQITVLERIISVAPNHRTALWLLGNIYMKSQNNKLQQLGIAMKLKAEGLGVKRVYPVLE